MKKLLLKTISFYKKHISILGVCRCEPTCSSYAYEAIEKYGAFKGSVMGLKRILRCNTLFTPVAGTYDPVI